MGSDLTNTPPILFPYMGSDGSTDLFVWEQYGLSIAYLEIPYSLPISWGNMGNETSSEYGDGMAKQHKKMMAQYWDGMGADGWYRSHYFIWDFLDYLQLPFQALAILGVAAL